jgi:hypothetical protein
VLTILLFSIALYPDFETFSNAHALKRPILVSADSIHSAMHAILITGSTGNVGKEVIRALLQRNAGVTIYAGVRDTIAFTGFETAGVEKRSFNFSDEAMLKEERPTFSNSHALIPLVKVKADGRRKPFFA